MSGQTEYYGLREIRPALPTGGSRSVLGHSDVACELNRGATWFLSLANLLHRGTARVDNVRGGQLL